MTVIDAEFREYMYGYMSWPPEDREDDGKPRYLGEILAAEPDEGRLPVNNREPRELMSKQKYALILARDGVGCRYCYNGNGGVEIDHIVPRSVFPPEKIQVADRSDNLCVACVSCNQAKSNRNYGYVKRPGVVPACWECLNPSPDQEADPVAAEAWGHQAAANRNHLVFCGRCGVGGSVPSLSWVL